MPPDDAIVKPEDRLLFEYVFSEFYNRKAHRFDMRLIRKFRAGWGGYIISPSLREAILALGACYVNSTFFFERKEKYMQNCRHSLMTLDAADLSSADLLASTILWSIAPTENERKIHRNGSALILGLLNSSNRNQHQSQEIFAPFRPVFMHMVFVFGRAHSFDALQDDQLPAQYLRLKPSMIDYRCSLEALDYSIYSSWYTSEDELREMLYLLKRRFVTEIVGKKVHDGLQSWIKERKYGWRHFQQHFQGTFDLPSTTTQLQHDEATVWCYNWGSLTSLSLSLLFVLLESQSLQESIASPEATGAGLWLVQYIFTSEGYWRQCPRFYMSFTDHLLFIGGATLHAKEYSLSNVQLRILVDISLVSKEIIEFFVRSGRTEMAEEMSQYWESSDLTCLLRVVDQLVQLWPWY